MNRKQQPRKVILALWTAGSPGRKHLAGILRYINEGHHWLPKLITDPKDFTTDVIAAAEAEGYDGFLCCVTADAAPVLAKSSVPTVLMDFPPPALMRRKTSLALMFNDEENIGRRSADYFRQLGAFAAHAFVPDAENRGWSRMRQRGYAARLKELGQKCWTYDRRKTDLVDWLKSLPLPAAVFAPSDFIATDVITACDTAGLAIPRQISVLGVDDDEIICNNFSPTLSSVRIEHEQHGYDCAALLDRMMSVRKPFGQRKFFLKAGGIVERESTHAPSPAAHLVSRAKDFIRAHVTDGIHVADVVAHLGVSRRLADRRISDATGSSIRRLIEDSRLDFVRSKLRTTKLSIDQIARLAGYANPQRLKYVFKSRYGMTMSAWRVCHDQP